MFRVLGFTKSPKWSFNKSRNIQQKKHRNGTTVAATRCASRALNTSKWHLRLWPRPRLRWGIIQIPETPPGFKRATSRRRERGREGRKEGKGEENPPPHEINWLRPCLPVSDYLRLHFTCTHVDRAGQLGAPAYKYQVQIIVVPANLEFL